VGAPALRRAAWAVAATLAAGVILTLAFHGRRPDPSLARFEAAGVMLAIAPESVTEVEIARGAHRWRFVRAGAGGWTAPPGPPPGERVRTGIDGGLHFLHVSAPQRVLQRDELAGTPPSDFGLDPPRFTVSVRAPASAPFTIEFGALNPQGLAQYARIAGRSDLLLLPGFVGEPWEAVMDSR
jgi:hypothetical protein